ncbi:MAG: N-acetylmuramic acid 6-phosphate etherase [Cyanobacteria bacterium P01_H01_bin.74]
MDAASLKSVVATENINPRTTDIDLLSAGAILHKINADDQLVATAVQRAIPQITGVVEKVVSMFHKGHRLFYFGAGTSGRLGVLDASECPPTYGVSPEMVQGIIAGGDTALRSAVEGAEDDPTLAVHDFTQAGITSSDAVIGISASGHAPYVVTAMKTAQRKGCFTACISGVETSELVKAVDQAIVIDTGPEVITGSTRMKAGTAQKLVLNMITTSAMVLMGKTYQNLMVDLRPSNSKLVKRAIRIVSGLGEISEPEAEALLLQTDFSVKPAILMARYSLSFEAAAQLLAENQNKLRAAIQAYTPERIPKK